MLIYQSSVIYEVQLIHRKMSQLDFQASSLCDQLLQSLDPIEEFTRKFFVTQDEAYRQRMRRLQGLFSQDLKSAGSLLRSGEEVAQFRRLSWYWEEYQLVTSAEPMEFGQPQDWLSSQLESLENLRGQTREVIQATHNSINLQVRRAARLGERAEWISLTVALLVIALSVLASYLVVRSVSRSVNQLTEGTLAIAKGDFAHRLDSSGTDEFSEVAQNFNSMAQQLGELDQMKEDFISHVSHELKTPLGSVQETINLLLEEIPGALSPEQKRLLELNLQSTHRLSSMIRNLLDLSRMEAGIVEYQRKSCDLNALALLALSELEPQLHEQNLQVATRFTQPLSVECDEDRILQVIVNLLGNAIKFSPKGATVSVEVDDRRKIPLETPPTLRRRLSSSNNGFALLAVSDRGPGVPEPHKERVFEKFHQIHQGKKLRGQGVGLGLAICKSIVEKHEGAIWVEDRPAGGSVFRVLLPERTPVKT